MRSAILIPALMLAACNVTKDENNGSVSVQYDENLAENTVEAVSEEASDIAGHISNDVQATGAKINDEVGEADVDADVDVDVNTNSN